MDGGSVGARRFTEAPVCSRRHQYPPSENYGSYEAATDGSANTLQQRFATDAGQPPESSSGLVLVVPALALAVFVLGHTFSMP
jgi:hypothetical protein